MTLGRLSLAACVAALALAGGCIRFSPFEVDLPDRERDQIAKNLAKLRSVTRAPVSADDPMTFAFIADTHDGYDSWKSIVAAMNTRPEIELTLHGGDMTDFGTDQEYRWAYDVYSRENSPFLPAPGNHDGLAEGTHLFAQMFGPTNYTFDYRGVHFVVFNSNPVEWGLPAPDYAWLEDALRTEEKTTIVLSHQAPRYEPAAPDENVLRCYRILAAANVPLYLYGHRHDGFGTQIEGPTTFTKTQTALLGSWMLVHFDGERFDYETCAFSKCEAGPLPVGLTDIESPEELATKIADAGAE